MSWNIKARGVSVARSSLKESFPGSRDKESISRFVNARLSVIILSLPKGYLTQNSSP